MGLLDKLITDGTNLSPWDGSDPSTNILATDQSPLHAFGTSPGYSLNQSFAGEVIAAAAAYSTNGYGGIGNGLPQTVAALDLNGAQPTGPLSGAPIPINNSFINGTYFDSAPEGANFGG
jgi:hypothetical protein